MIGYKFSYDKREHFFYIDLESVGKISIWFSFCSWVWPIGVNLGCLRGKGSASWFLLGFRYTRLMIARDCYYKTASDFRLRWFRDVMKLLLIWEFQTSIFEDFWRSNFKITSDFKFIFISQNGINPSVITFRVQIFSVTDNTGYISAVELCIRNCQLSFLKWDF